MKNKEYISIEKMIEYINRAIKYTQESTFEEFSNNQEKIDATVFAISQIGELVKNISNETMRKYPKIPWIIIKNLRNKIVHDYDGIKLDVIWDIIHEDIDILKNQLNKILSEENM